MRIFGSFRRPRTALATAGAPPSPGVIRPPARHRRDREFLPAALEIIEQPPSPIAMAMLVLICLLFVTALSWSYFGRLDIVAVASGKFQPEGRVKTIQPVRTGRVVSIEARNGTHVAAGDLLVRLDPAETEQDAKNAVTSFASYRAEALRRAAAVEAARGDDLPAIAWPDTIPKTLQVREEAVLTSDLTELRSTLANLKAQLAGKDAQKRRLDDTIAAQSSLVATLKERVDMRTSLVNTGSGAKAAVLDAKETYGTQAATLAYENGQRAEMQAAVDVAQSDLVRRTDAFVAENQQKRAEAERQADDFAEKLAKAKIQIEQLTITTPIAGVIQGSTVTTVGQVVTVGEELMRIVPDGTRLEIEAYLPNKDIGFVAPGQEAVVKVESFPFTRYGTLRGKVVRVASDAIPEPEATSREETPTKPSPATTVGGGQHVRDLVFPVTVAVEAETIEADGRPVPLSPGMAVTVDIKTGTRHMLDYLVSPVLETSSSAMHER